jgi:hypothetical protein
MGRFVRVRLRTEGYGLSTYLKYPPRSDSSRCAITFMQKTEPPVSGQAKKADDLS